MTTSKSSDAISMSTESVSGSENESTEPLPINAIEIQEELRDAISNNLTSVFKKLYEEHSNDIRQSGPHGQKYLSLAACSGSSEIASYLVSQPGIDLDIYHPLWWAARNGSNSVLAILLAQKHIDVNKYVTCSTALRIATMRRKTTTVGILLKDLRVDINRTHDGLGEDYEDGRTPLLEAVALDDAVIFNMLLAAPAVDVNATDLMGRTALILAAQISSLEKVEGLLSHKAINTSIVDENGRDALWYAKKKNATNIVTALSNHLVDSKLRASHQKQKRMKTTEGESRRTKAEHRRQIGQMVEQEDWEGLDRLIDPTFRQKRKSEVADVNRKRIKTS